MFLIPNFLESCLVYLPYISFLKTNALLNKKRIKAILIHLFFIKKIILQNCYSIKRFQITYLICYIFDIIHKILLFGVL